MKPVERILNFRAVIARGAPWMALLGLVACATTTTPVSRQADPAFARKVVAYPSRLKPYPSRFERFKTPHLPSLD